MKTTNLFYASQHNKNASRRKEGRGWITWWPTVGRYWRRGECGGGGSSPPAIASVPPALSAAPQGCTKQLHRIMRSDQSRGISGHNTVAVRRPEAKNRSTPKSRVVELKIFFFFRIAYSFGFDPKPAPAPGTISTNNSTYKNNFLQKNSIYFCQHTPI